MFIFSALVKRGSFLVAKVVTFGEMCNTLEGIYCFHFAALDYSRDGAWKGGKRIM